VKIEKEIKSFPFEVKATAEENNIFTFEGYASTFNNVDHGDDIVIRGAFSNSLAKNSQVPILWQHQMSEVIGVSVQLYEDDKGLFIKGNLPKDDTLVSGRIIPQMKVGSIKEMSIGFFTKNYDRAKDGIRLLKEIDLFEVSLVTKAMNSQALVTGFKSFETLRDIEQTLKDNGFSNTEAKTLISKIKEFSSKRDASEDNQRDADATKQKIITDLNNFINNLKK
jgi:HK97 family phage prohead protease